MTDAKSQRLWEFARGDGDQAEFEAWLYENYDLENLLGAELHWQLVSCDFKNRDEVWQVRQTLHEHLAKSSQCECHALRDRSAVAMGGSQLEDGRFYHEKVFSTLHEAASFGQEKWWLYISKCDRCEAVWLVAQDDRIYDEFFLVRIGEADLIEAIAGHWPPAFQSYEQVLAAGLELSQPPRFVDPMAMSLQWTVEDLLHERLDVGVDRIAALLGLSRQHTELLVKKVSKKSSGSF